MSILAIRLYPDPVLRERSQEVTQFDATLDKLVADMIETMHAAPGVGLAAPQVGISRRVAVVDVSVGKNPEDLHVLINPELTLKSGADVDVEGCLSLPGITDKVERPVRIQVKALDRQGQPYELEAEGFLARAVCHEIDHLNGVLFTDHLRGLRKERARRQLKRLASGAPVEAAVEAPV
ncbi:MAG TPA: peptide deformylase [Thermoanaerobaculia bacterium]|nr:peptide deformylase [Thermoanaerobaculia bacterium]